MTMSKLIEQIERAKIELNELVKQLENEKSWLIKKGEKYHFVRENGEASSYMNQGDDIDKAYNLRGNILRTEQEAKAQYRHEGTEVAIRRFARDYNDGWKANWDDPSQNKWYFVYYNKKRFDTITSYTTRIPNTIYFKDYEFESPLIELIGRDKVIQWIEYDKPIYVIEE